MADEANPLPAVEQTPEVPAAGPALPGITPSGPPPKRRRLRRRLAFLGVGLMLGYLVTAYLILPAAWRWYGKRYPGLEDIPRITYTKSGIPGDALNVALIGTEGQVKKIMVAARWYPADPLTLRSCLEIAEASVLKRPYDDAPVSNLYLAGHKQDLAFEQPVGDDPRRRHHVRFWRSQDLDPDGRPVWVGAAVFDAHVGLSRTTGQVTHVTGPDIDAERDYLFTDLKRTGDLAETYVIAGFHTVREGRNGGGDPWHTDGDLYVGVIKP
jgi:hypothetical protein